MQLILATRNAHKLREIQRILGPKFAVGRLSDRDKVAEVHESGSSYEENAILKAATVSRQLPGLIVADDSGLEVDALGGAPGTHSARYAGQHATDKENIYKLLGELARVGARENKRSARFRCVLALARDSQILATFEGTVEGMIADRARGRRGFGYDPIFIPAGFEKTFGELRAEVKNRISHRGQAIRDLAAKLAALESSD
jgi:XTP/dITP diphosphohydrolase